MIKNTDGGLLPRETYREIMDLAPICSVDILFFNKDKTEVLLFKRENEPLKGVYYGIGGMIKKNETIESCALRQAKREAGLNISRDELIFGGIQEEIHPNSVFENVSYHAINIFYGYILDDIEQIKLDEQHEEYKWFSVNNETLHPFITAKIKKLLEI